MTEEFVRSALSGYEALAVRIKEVAIQIATIRKTTRNPAEDYSSFKFEEGKLYVKFEYYCYGDNNEKYVCIPLEYLWTKNLIDTEKVRYAAEIAENLRLNEERKKKEEAESRRIAEERERQTYERLKKKFETTLEDANG